MNQSVDLRLPGVVFLPHQPAARLVLPPLDAAAFVGFAERGPLHLPVAIKDFDTYRKVFGGDLALAREPGGRIAYGNLPRTVQAFFINGGQRCYIVRVAGDRAEAARFRLPGVVALDGRSGPKLAGISASSQGTWGSHLRLASRLAVTPLPAEACVLEKISTGNWSLHLASNHRWPSGLPLLKAGDVLRVELQDGSHWLAPLVRIERLSDQDAGQSNLEQSTRLHFAKYYRVLDNLSSSPPEEVQELELLTVNGKTPLRSRGLLGSDGDCVVLRLYPADVAKVKVGDIILLRMSGRPAGDPGFLARLMEIRAATDPWLSPPETAFEAVFSSFMQLAEEDLPLDLFSSPPAMHTLRSVELLRLDLLIKLEQHYLPEISGLAFNTPHPRFWGDAVLLDSSLLNGRSTTQSRKFLYGAAGDKQVVPAQAATNWFRHLIRDPYNLAPTFVETDATQELKATGFSPISALAGLLAPTGSSLTLSRAAVEAASSYIEAAEELSCTYLPLGLSEIFNEADPTQFLPPESGQTGKDDLDQFDTAVFYDSRLAPPGALGSSGLGESQRNLLQTAFDLHYLHGRQLRGMHGLLFIDEVAMISMPDAVQTPWEPGVTQPALAPPKPSAPEREQECPAESDFMPCNLAPLLSAVEPHYGLLDQETSVTIIGECFTTTPQTQVYFGTRAAEEVRVESSTRLNAIAPIGVRPGPVDVRIENENGNDLLPNAFNYINESTQLSLPLVTPHNPFEPVQDSPFLAVQQALVALCQARGDVLAVLSLPRDYDAQRCQEWQDTFRRKLRLPTLNEDFSYEEPTEIADLSFAAVYHPWLLTSDARASDLVRGVPPDGAVCGMIAKRERERYVWVAPANRPLVEVLGLQSDISEDDWAELFARRFNLVRPESQGFRAMSAHTLSGERGLMQISVRRMLIQLRKAAIELGMDFVFQSNHELFREGVRSTLEGLLRFMFERGAFAGRNESESFRVITDNSVNPPEAIEQGRFVAVIQVAPSGPAEFITVQLTRHAGGDLLAEEL